MQESSYNVEAVLRSRSSPSGIGQSEMVGLGVGKKSRRPRTPFQGKNKNKKVEKAFKCKIISLTSPF
jgi:hypothetical protein